MSPIIPVIAGPTAVGKTAVSVALAGLLDAEIISADSRQIYAPFRIGTARPTEVELQKVAHHLIGELPLDAPYSAGLFAQRLQRIIPDLRARDKRGIVVGGSTLYVHALIEGLSDIPPIEPGIRDILNAELEDRGSEALYAELLKVDPVFAATVDPSKSQRIVRGLEVFRGTATALSQFHQPPPLADQRYQLIVLHVDRDMLYARIDQRVDDMISEGLLEECSRALEMAPDRTLNAWRTIGYQEILPWLDGKYDLEEAIRLIKRNSRRYAKRQLTWYRRYTEAVWIETADRDSADIAEQILKMI